MAIKHIIIAVTLICIASSLAIAAALTNGNTSGDWTYICATAKGKIKPSCEITLTQTVKNKKTGENNRLLSISIAKLGKGHVLQAIVPLGISLPAGIALKVDENKQVPMTVQRCTNGGCEALINLKQATINKMKKGKKIQVGFNVGKKTMVIPASLKGFTKAIKKLN